MKLRRLIPRLLLCLMLGFLTTVALAWLAVLAIRFSSNENMRTCMRLAHPDNIEYGVTVNRWDVFGGVFVRTNVILESAILKNYPDVPRKEFGEELPSQMLPPWARPVGLPWLCGEAMWPVPTSAPLSTPSDWRDIEARGWPMLAVWMQYDKPSFGTYTAHGGIPISFASDQTRPYTTNLYQCALPYRPIPLGLTTDTLFFAFAWSVLLYAPSRIRRAVRLRRGLCPACGYNLSGLPPTAPCPECGKGVAA